MLLENLSTLLSVHMAAHNHPCLQFEGIQHPPLPLWTPGMHVITNIPEHDVVLSILLGKELRYRENLIIEFIIELEFTKPGVSKL